MAVIHDDFPARKRCPPVGAFVPPKFSDRRLLQSLLILSQEISALEPLRILFRKTSASVIRKVGLFSILFEELVQDPPVTSFPPSAVLCFEELYIALQRIKVLLEDCSACSRMWLLMQIPSISNSFHQLIVELSTLLDIFPAKELDLSEDLVELVNLIKKQCSEKSAECLDLDDSNLRTDVLKMLENIKRKIVPDYAKLSEIFEKLNLTDSTSCSNEIQNLEEEVQNQEDKSRAEAIALIGLVRYAKCVLYGASTPKIAPRRQRSAAEVNIPADFRCPISLDLMRDPVVVSTGQTYDRSSIAMWIESGHVTCPKTGQPLAHAQLISNLALKNLIAMWCRDQGIPFDATEVNVKPSGVFPNKTALEATKMTVSFLVGNLTTAQTAESADRLVYELRALSKTDSDSRACIVDAGALPSLVKFLASDNPSLQINAVTTILNLSILETNKTRIMETDGVLSGVIEVLTYGSTWEAKGNAAATIFSLTGVHAYRKKLGKRTRVIRALLDLAKSGPTNSKRDALMAILNLAGDREVASRLIEAGVMNVIEEAVESLAEEAVAILETVVKRCGLGAISVVYEGSMVSRLARVMRDGSERARESAAATLVSICRKGGSEMAAQLSAVAGIERVIWELMGTGTGRARRKAATLLRVLRRWAAGLVPATESLNTVVEQSTSLSNMMMGSSTRIVLPA
ncbi:hypothetical protein M569_00792 [Genlisea aurea]|uniref:RING-type E3 ubiquitin transferase n=1 Tax=Genlisea aurea TaxID=192259 RepID=S8D2K8_9LAMI|nr:hypothetical protein M569_00792 [Genlisea aurea]